MGGPNVKAICLLSGGLDSSLAAKLVLDQGVRVLAVNFVIPFGRCGNASESPARRMADSLGAAFRRISLGSDYLEVVRHPHYGYGSNVNPCIDCRIFMLRRAGEMMDREGASFVVTGEVVGQRPMSQRLDTMRRIEKDSGLEGLLLRPLSAKLLAPTIPEIEGWVNRDALLAVSGRSRKELIKLAGELGVTGYTTPGGGCLLTDPKFAGRVRDLLAHDTFTLDDVELLKVGRHLRFPGGPKLVVGRNEGDNEELESLAVEGDTVLTTEECPGPVAMSSQSVLGAFARSTLATTLPDSRNAKSVAFVFESPCVQ